MPTGCAYECGQCGIMTVSRVSVSESRRDTLPLNNSTTNTRNRTIFASIRQPRWQTGTLDKCPIPCQRGFSLRRSPMATLSPSQSGLSVDDQIADLTERLTAIDLCLAMNPDAEAEQRFVGLLTGIVMARLSARRGLREPSEVLRYVSALMLAQANRDTSYDDYLRTEHWRTTRMAALDRADHRCELCNADRQLQVHHKTYERLWHEQPNDLIVLCDGCHSRFHDKLPGRAA